MLAEASVWPSGAKARLEIKPVCSMCSASSGMVPTSSPVCAPHTLSTNTPRSESVLRPAMMKRPSGEKVIVPSLRCQALRRKTFVDLRSSTGALVFDHGHTARPALVSVTTRAPSGEKASGPVALGSNTCSRHIAVSQMLTPSRWTVARRRPSRDRASGP